MDGVKKKKKRKEKKWGRSKTDPVDVPSSTDQALRADASVSNKMSTALLVSFQTQPTLLSGQDRKREDKRGGGRGEGLFGDFTVVRLKNEHRSKPDGPFSAPTHVNASLLAQPHHFVSTRTVKRDERAPVLSP